MTNGFEIHISETDFKAKPPSDQNWILFQGVTEANKCIQDIDENGCEYARKKQKGFRLRLAYAFGAGIAGGAGVIYMIFQVLHHSP